MKLASINLGLLGSTGNIMFSISKKVIENGGSALMIYPNIPYNQKGFSNDCVFGSNFNRKINAVLERISGYQGCFSFCNTRKVIKALKGFSPDVLHLHNIHGVKINLPKLFKYIKKKNITVVWTLHDCWSFTGQCPHFIMAKCDKWLTGCHRCPQYKLYPRAYVDRTKAMWKLKRKWFTGIENMTLVTPSKWLADLVKQSYLKDYPVKVINNGIDLSVFKPTGSDFREKYHLQDKFIVLGVAFGWDKRKGLDVFVDLSKRLDDKYKVVLVGTDDEVDEQLPDNIISLHRTQNQAELAEIYTVADVFVNPTREENYPTVNMEALACGTPVVTFNTGGSPEILDDTCGSVVDCDDNDAMLNEIVRICETGAYSKENCLNRAKAFDKNERFKEYIELYKEI